jgi:dienelactone hydrolase
VRFAARLLLALALLAGGCGGGGGGGRVSLTASAPSPLADAPVTVTVRGLDGGEHATLHASWRAYGGHEWTSSVPVTADGSGRVALHGLDGMRFLWGMRATGPAFKNQFFFLPVVGPSAATLSLSAGGKTVARTSVSRRITPSSVRVRKLSLRRDGLVGELFTPAGKTRKPGVVVFGGSEGGDYMIDAAALLAGHGYPTISLAYFGEPGLPKQLVNVKLEYFARAVRLLRRRPGVDPGHVLVMGDSRGGEAALLLASTFPDLIHGAIGLVPSDTVYPAPAAELRAWTLHGRPVPLEPIPVERISGPVLTAGAGDDKAWSSAPSVRSIEHRLNVHHFRHPHHGLIYKDAGHLIGTAVPYLPSPPDEGLGGTARADSAAKADLWPRILQTLAEAGSGRQ